MDSEYEEFAQMLDMNCFKLITKSEMRKLGFRQIGAGYVYRCRLDYVPREKRGMTPCVQDDCLYMLVVRVRGRI